MPECVWIRILGHRVADQDVVFTREAGALHSIVSQLNWRGDNKFVHLQGASPMLPPDHLAGSTGQETLRHSIYDFSVRQPSLTDKVGSAVTCGCG